jgi:alpha-tubulin suppressor-like RCC1 family protein
MIKNFRIKQSGLCTVLALMTGFALLTAITILHSNTKSTKAISAVSVTPSSGPISGGTEITITGTDMKIENKDDIIQLAAGYVHSLALTSTGQVYAWGSNWDGQLGYGTIDDPYESPTPINITSSFAGLTGQITQIAAGDSHSIALTSTGQVYAWGADNLGQLGDGVIDSPVDNPVPIDITANFAGMNGQIIQIAARALCSMALTSTGQVYFWGDNSYSRTIGNPTPTNITSSFADITDQITQLTAGGYHAMALTRTGQVYTWGDGWAGQLGDGVTDVPGENSGPFNVTSNFAGLTGQIIQLEAGDSHSLALTSTGQVYAWGVDWDGQLGDGTVGDPLDNPIPINITSSFAGVNGHITQLSTNYSHSLALTSTGQVYTWGGDWDGQLGDGTTSNPYENPTPINITGNFTGLDGQTIQLVAAGQDHSLALTSTGQVYTWGWDAGSQLGDGTSGDPDDNPTPINITANFDFTLPFTITLGNKPCTDIITGANNLTSPESFASDGTWAKCRVPANTAGFADITINNGLTTTTLDNGYEYKNIIPGAPNTGFKE